jgi:carboxyl-terminal processing protease
VRSTRPAAWAAALAIAFVAGCAQLPSRPASGPIADLAHDAQASSDRALSPVYASERARRATALTVWRLVQERFYDPRLYGVDWPAVRERALPAAAAARSDAELYRVLRQMTAELREPHTEVLTPRESLDRRRFVAARNGLTLGVVEGEVAVLEVEPGSAAAAAGVQPGDLVQRLNGTPIDARFVREAAADPATLTAKPLAGDGPQALPADARDAERVRAMRALRRLIAADADGARVPARIALELSRPSLAAPLAVEAVAEVRARAPSAQMRWLPGEIAWIRFDRFDSSLRAELERALDAAAAARALIVDLRGNGGGQLQMFRWFAGQFLPERRVAMHASARDRADAQARSLTEMAIGPGARPLLQPLAVLIDGRTASSAELAALALAEQREALLVGEPSCGCAVAVRVEYVLPDGGGLRIAETGFVSARGARIQGAPIAPALRVLPTLADLRAGHDPVLEAARQKLARATQPAAAAAR